MSEELSMKDLQMKSLTEKIEMMLKGLDKSKRQELVRGGRRESALTAMTRRGERDAIARCIDGAVIE